MPDDQDTPLSPEITDLAQSLRAQAIRLDDNLAEQLQRCADLCEDYAVDREYGAPIF